MTLDFLSGLSVPSLASLPSFFPSGGSILVHTVHCSCLFVLGSQFNARPPASAPIGRSIWSALPQSMYHIRQGHGTALGQEPLTGVQAKGTADAVTRSHSPHCASVALQAFGQAHEFQPEYKRTRR